MIFCATLSRLGLGVWGVWASACFGIFRAVPYVEGTAGTPYSSQRLQEVVAENLVVGEFGEVQSVCGTHLGHNLPDEKVPLAGLCFCR